MLAYEGIAYIAMSALSATNVFSRVDINNESHPYLDLAVNIEFYSYRLGYSLEHTNSLFRWCSFR